MNPLDILRENIKTLSPYSSARDEYEGKTGVFLDANENPFTNGYNRYPDPMQWELKQKLAAIKKINPESILLGNGSDEVIDLLFRAFCKPGVDEVIVLPPTYGMYKVSASINDIHLREVNLTRDFQIDVPAVVQEFDEHVKLLFICSPNNPSGNVIPKSQIEELLNSFKGIVVVDEAYIDFCPEYSTVPLLDKYPNLVVMQTLSKAWGLAGARVGIMIANPSIIRVMNKIKAPYNLGIPAQEIAMKRLDEVSKFEEEKKVVIVERKKLAMELTRLSFVEKVFPSDANFLLVRFSDSKKVFNYLINEKVIVRDRSSVVLCDDCLRISIGLPAENAILLEKLKSLTN
ncbi:MAG: histidinol-phosphate transaminase [Flavobacteriales bacterium]|nr:histidinol-phosphate transaminase [Flavobacteriales bacterium]